MQHSLQHYVAYMQGGSATPCAKSEYNPLVLLRCLQQANPLIRTLILTLTRTLTKPPNLTLNVDPSPIPNPFLPHSHEAGQFLRAACLSCPPRLVLTLALTRILTPTLTLTLTEPYPSPSPKP